MVEQIAIGSLDSPIGPLWTACSDRGVCRVLFPREAEKQPLERWMARHMHKADQTTTSPLLERTFEELTQYFDGTRHGFTLPLDLWGNAFEQRVWNALAQIPYGQTLSYGEVARQLDDPRSARAVGAACGANPVPIIVP